MKYYISVVAIVKDELYLIEWIEHHLSLGVDFFLIYDNNSCVPVSEILRIYVQNGTVRVVECQILNFQQIKAYNHSLYELHELSQWVAYIDADEFIKIRYKSDIKHFLRQYEEFGGVCLNWKVVTANTIKGN